MDDQGASDTKSDGMPGDEASMRLMPKVDFRSAQGRSAPINPPHDSQCSGWLHYSGLGARTQGHLVPAEGLGAVAYRVEIAGDGS
jgi:hypothetical protein